MANELNFTLLFLFLSIGDYTGVDSQNLSKYYRKHCDSNAVIRDSSKHISECNTDMDPVTENYVYIPLLCVDWSCTCPNRYSLKGKELNATGYEWKEEKSQCLLSDDSECVDLTLKLCASGNCYEGKCLNATQGNRNTGNKNQRHLIYSIFPLAIGGYYVISVIVVNPIKY